MTDPLATSAAPWDDGRADAPVIDPRLVPPTGAGAVGRVRAFRERHRLRRENAERVYAESRNPVRGWPVADDHVVWAFFRSLVAERKGRLTEMLAFNALAAIAALAAPYLLGILVDRTVAGDAGAVDTFAVVIAGVVIAQAVFRFLAQRSSTLFGQDLLATAREYVVSTVLRLPVGQVEGASTGDLVTRVTRDVGTMSRSVQWGLPRLLITLITVLLSTVAMLVNSWILAVPAILTIATSWFTVRRYLDRAPKGYITEGSTYSRINTTLTETVEGARTVEALGLADLRAQQGEDDIAVSAQAERYTMSLRNLLFVVIDFAFNTPRVVTLAVGAWGYANGWVSIGQITAAMLYVEALSGPLDQLVGELDRRRWAPRPPRDCSGSPRCRRTGRRARRPRRAAPGRPRPALRLPRRHRRAARRRPGAARRGNGWRSSGRPGPASPPSAGCCPASTARARARSPSAASSWSSCRWRRCAPRSRSSPRSTTSSAARSATT